MRQARLRLRGILLAILIPALLSVGVIPALAKASPPALRSKTWRAMAPRTSHYPVATHATRPLRRLKAAAQARKILTLIAHVRMRKPAPTLPLVVVDAGHGGRDAGAIGQSGTLEKTIALATAQELGRQLRATKRYRVMFTRDGDTFVPLPARVRFAVVNGAALMISIHADASVDRRARGASVYVRPARSSGPDVAQLPARDGSSRAIARALAEPMQPIPGSARLQLALVERLDDDLSMVPDPARQGRFYVLGALGIPSVLVETGFISNSQDEALLRQPRHRAVVARAIRDAADKFFANHQQLPSPRT